MSTTLPPDTILPWHAAAWRRIAAGAERGQVAHALLIHGEGGLHKLQLGRQVGQGLLCEQPVAARACNHCRGCLLYLSGNHPDWIEVHPVDSAVIKIDQIRELSSRLSMRPQIARRQVALVWPAEQMNLAAANALLKTLEEPSADTHLLLLADRIGRLPATIRSRCQRLPLLAVDDAVTVDAVAQLAHVDAVRARVALALAGNDPELAVENLRPETWSALATVTKRLIDLARGGLGPIEFSTVGKGEGGLLLQRWSRLIALGVRGDRLGSEPFDAWIDLTSRVEMSTLLPLATQLERARGLAGSGVREDLLIYDLAVRWSQAFNHEERRRAP